MVGAFDGEAFGVVEVDDPEGVGGSGDPPHLVETFKLSNDKRFEEKLKDVVELYLNPPPDAVILSVDEKSQIQALNRTQPSLPHEAGPGGHDDARLQAQRHHDFVRGVEHA